MNCPMCRGMMKPGNTSMLIQQDENSAIVINNVPGLICEQCGEDYIGLEIARKIEALMDRLKSEGIKMGFIDYSKAA